MKTINILVTLLIVAMMGMASVNGGEYPKQDVSVTAVETTGLEVSPSSYNYGDVGRGQYSGENPDGEIRLNNTGTTNLTITINTTGIFKNIEYKDGGNWNDTITFSTRVNHSDWANISTRIYIPVSKDPKTYSGNVTFEYTPKL